MQPILSWTDGYLAVRARAQELRGVVDAASDATRWPRTTGDDVIVIASLVDPSMRGLYIRDGAIGIVARWETATDDLLAHALAEREAEYRANETFWPTLAAVCVYLDSIDSRPPPQAMWEALVADLGQPPEFRNASTVTTYDKMWTEQRAQLADKRGSDREASGFIVPHTTSADVLQLAIYWTDALADARQLMGWDGVATKWKATVMEVLADARTAKPSDLYPKNAEFWHASWQVAMQVAATEATPTKWEMFVDFAKESIADLPKDLWAAAKKIGGALESAAERGAHEVGAVVGQAGRGLFGGVGGPIAIAAGLVGVYLFVRSRRAKSES
jgi:hypothetical protein